MSGSLVFHACKYLGLFFPLFSIGALAPPETAETRERAQLFEDLLRESETQIFRIAYRLAGNRDDAEDLIQQSVIEALRSFDKFHVGSRFDRWMQQIITHNYIDAWRVKQKVQVDSLDKTWADDEGEAHEIEVPDSREDPGYLIEARHLEEPVQRALDTLSPEYRAVVVLSDIEGYSYDEIAAALKVPVGTVRSRLNRGRNSLRKKLAFYARERYGL